MKSMRTGWLSHSIVLAAAVVVAWIASPAWAGYELPPGERITNLPHIPRAMPQKEAYETYDPTIGRNFDIKNFWMRADLRVRPEWRTNVCFGGGPPIGGACTTAGGARANAPAFSNGSGATVGGQTKSANDFYVQQWVRLGIGYDLSPDVNFYFEIIDAATWGANGSPTNAGNGGDPLNHSCGAGGAPTGNTNNCRLGVRAAYVLVRNLAGVQGLSMKAGRQYVIFGNHSIFGHFDWANTGYSHDGIMFAYQTKAVDSYLGWFRNSESDLGQAAPVGSLASNLGVNATAAGANGVPDAGRDADMFIFYNQIKNVPGWLFEPYYVLYINQFASGASGVGAGSPKQGNQIRHHIALRAEMRKGNWDFIEEFAWQTGRMGDPSAVAGNALTPNPQQRNLTINAYASRTWLGYTWYENRMKPRFAVNLDYASGDNNANCNSAAAVSGTNPIGKCRTANTFENFFPTNHIHMGYADVIAWKNMVAPQLNFQFRPTERDHFEIWYMNMNLQSSKDCYYRAAQGCYIWSKSNNNKKHIGDEIDFTWTRMFADGKVAFQATYSQIFTGGYMTANMPGTPKQQSWGFVQLWMNF